MYEICKNNFYLLQIFWVIRIQLLSVNNCMNITIHGVCLIVQVTINVITPRGDMWILFITIIL